jgi:hypothetical protein
MELVADDSTGSLAYREEALAVVEGRPHLSLV